MVFSTTSVQDFENITQPKIGIRDKNKILTFKWKSNAFSMYGTYTKKSIIINQKQKPATIFVLNYFIKYVK